MYATVSTQINGRSLCSVVHIHVVPSYRKPLQVPSMSSSTGQTVIYKEPVSGCNANQGVQLVSLQASEGSGLTVSIPHVMQNPVKLHLRMR